MVLLFYSQKSCLASENNTAAQILQLCDKAYQEKEELLFYCDNLETRIEYLKNKYKNVIRKNKQEIQWTFNDVTKIDLKNKNIHTMCALNDNDIIVPIFKEISPNLDTITEIDISYNKLTYLLLPCITHVCPHLTILHANNNAIEYIALGDESSQHNKLKTIMMSHNKIPLLSLSHILYLYPNLDLIDISHNPLKKVELQPTYFIKNLPRFKANDTELSLQTKKMFFNQYNDVMKMPLYKKIVSLGMSIGCFCGIAELVRGYAYNEYSLTDSMIHGPFGLGVATGIMASLYMYYRHYSTLKKIEQEIQDKLLWKME